MPTTQPRINITFNPATVSILTRLARQQKKSVASLTKDLVLDALERQEDIALSALAACREKEQVGKRVYTHKDAWK
jgi:hypothetical protein